MTQLTNEPTAINIPVELFKQALKSADDNVLAGFLQGYVLGTVADQFIRSMTGPNQRAEFFVAIAKTYPDDWKLAIEELSKD